MINKDVILGKWKEISGEAQKKWGEITENDLEKVKGNMTALVGLVEHASLYRLRFYGLECL